MDEVIIYGHYTGGESTQGGKVVSIHGIAPCVTGNHGMVTAILEENMSKDLEQYYLSDKMLAYVIDLNGSSTGGGVEQKRHNKPFHSTQHFVL